MATRQKNKDIVNFCKKLKKRYPNDATVLSREHKVLEHLVFAIFLENATFEQARSSFNKLERYFIDWNEVRVSKANEIANVIGNVPNAFKIGERLRRLLQWIFDKTFKFDLEDVRAKGVEETLSFLKSVPFSTRFMNEYVSLCGFGTKVFPMDEGVLRAFRLLGWVKVCDEQEVVPALDLVSDDADFLKLFFAAHTLGSELMDETTQKGAIKFLTTVDPGVAKRSFEPLVESALPTDPSEIAKLFAKRERHPKNVSASAMMNAMFGDETMDSDDIDESDDFEKDGFEKDGFEKDGDKGGFDPYGEESVGGVVSSDGFAVRRGTQDSAYSSGKRAETTLSKDGASYFESALDTAEQDVFDESRDVCSERDVKPRKRAKSVADVPEASRKSVRVVAPRSKKDDSRLNSKSDSTADDVAVVSASNEKKSREKKSNELSAAYEVESKPDGNEKAKKAEAKKAEVKKAEVKKASRTAKSKKESVVSKSDVESVEEANEKKSVASSASVSKEDSVDEGVKKEQKKSVKASKEAPKVSKSSLRLSVERVKSRAKSKEQNAVEDADSRPKRKRASTPPKEEPPATRSKKG